MLKQMLLKKAGQNGRDAGAKGAYAADARLRAEARPRASGLRPRRKPAGERPRRAGTAEVTLWSPCCPGLGTPRRHRALSGTVRAHRRGPREVRGQSRPGFHFSESSKSSESHLQCPSSSVSAAVTVCGPSTRHPPAHEG